MLPNDEDATNEAEAEAEVSQRLDNYGIQQLLEEGHRALLKELVVKVAAGTASKEDKALLAKMLKDNGMVWGGMPGSQEGASRQHMDLPELEKPDYE